MSILIREATERDKESIRRVNRTAFGSDVEGQLVDKLREKEFARVELVAEARDAIVGHILFSEVRIITADAVVPALALAPMAVVPEWQNHGCGSALVRDGLRLCAVRGGRIVIVVGHPAFYPRFGFSAERARPLASPYAGEACMALELQPGALYNLVGTVEYPPPFAELS